MSSSGLNAYCLNLVIARFCSEVAAEPMSFFSEADLQGVLFAKLIAEFPDQVETSYARGPHSKGKYKTGLIHLEYGAGGGRRVDLSLFDPEAIGTIDGPNLKVGKRYLKPRFAIELGTEKSLDTAGHIERDLKKLSNATERGYIIHFFRDTTRADTGTKRREGTEDRIKEIFKNPVHLTKPPSNVVALFFLLRLAHTHKKIFGKCELFLHETGTWEKVNLQSVRSKVLDRLA